MTLRHRWLDPRRHEPKYRNCSGPLREEAWLGPGTGLSCLQRSVSAMTSSPGSVLNQNECCLVMDVWAGGQESMAQAEDPQGMCQLMSSSLISLGIVACAQRQESKQAKEFNSTSLSSQDDRGVSFLEVLSGQLKSESRLGDTAEAGRFSWPVTDRVSMSLLGLELTE